MTTTINKRTQKDGKRFYEINTGKNEEIEYYPSSTTILESYPMELGLKQWLQDKSKDQADKLLHEAALQGSKIHHSIDLILKGEILLPDGINITQLSSSNLVADPEFGDAELIAYLQKPYSEKEDKMMRGFMQWNEDFKPETIASEQTIYSNKFKYAGTMDWIGYVKIKGKKELIIVDFKTGKSLYKSYDLQVASYLKAYNEMFKKNKKIKKPKKAYLLQLGINKCGYKFQEIKDVKGDFIRFKRMLDTWKDINKDAKPRFYEFANEYSINK